MLFRNRTRHVFWVFALGAVLFLGFSGEPVRAAESAGKITDVSGTVEIRQMGALGARSVRRWMNIFQDDVIETGEDGKVRILLNDSSVITLSGSSKLRVSEQVYDPKGGERRSLFNLFRGKVRAVVSKYVNAARSKFEIHTPTAVAGVRGTIEEVSYNPDTNQSALFLYEGSADWTDKGSGNSIIVGAGQFSVHLPGGTLSTAAFTPQMQSEQAADFIIETPAGSSPGVTDDLPTESYEESTEHVDTPEQTEQNTQDTQQGPTADASAGEGGGDTGDSGDTGDGGEQSGNDLTLTDNTGTLPVELDPAIPFSRVRLLVQPTP